MGQSLKSPAERPHSRGARVQLDFKSESPRSSPQSSLSRILTHVSVNPVVMKYNLNTVFVSFNCRRDENTSDSFVL